MLANDFGNFIALTRYENLPGSVVEAVKLRVLDVLGCALAGYHMGSHKALLPILGGGDEARVWGLGMKLGLRDATLLNSFVSHALGIADGSRFTGGHPAPVVVPGALALAETKRASGRDLIAAVAVGYEVFLRLGRAIYPSTAVRGFQSTSVVGAAASAAACASVLRLPQVQAKDALAIACTLGVGLKEASKSAGSRALQVARSCEGGVIAALFAEQGAGGADSIVEGGFLNAFAAEPQTAGMMTGLGTDFRIGETYIKVHGGCRGNHAPVDVVQAVVSDNALDPQDIAGIVVRVDSVTYAAEIHAPANAEQALFSVAFAIAAMLVNGDSSMFQYTDATLADPRIRSMMERIRVEVDKSLDAHFPHKRASAAEIALADGRRFEGHIDNARGEPESPFSAAEIEDKFLTLSRHMLPRGAERVRDLVMSLETLDDVNALTSALDP